MPSSGRHREFPGAGRVAEILCPRLTRKGELHLTIGPEHNEETGVDPIGGEHRGVHPCSIIMRP